MQTPAQLYVRSSRRYTGVQPPRYPASYGVRRVSSKGCVRYMGKAELFKHAWPARLFAALGGFPVERGGPDRTAMRAALAALDGGEPLGMFPEGTRRSGPIVHELFEGAAYVAARAGVPVVPVGIGGSERVMPKGSKLIRPAKVHVVVGEPFVVERPDGARVSRRAVHQLTGELHAELQRLFDLAQVRAGV